MDSPLYNNSYKHYSRDVYAIMRISRINCQEFIAMGLRPPAKNNCAKLRQAKLRRDWVHLQGALKVAYQDMWPSMQLSR